MSSVESQLVNNSYRLYALAELKAVCGLLIGMTDSEAPVKARPLWLQGSLSQLRQARKREFLRNSINRELGSILKDDPSQVRGVSPMRVEQLPVLDHDVLHIIWAKADEQSQIVEGQLLGLLEPSLDDPDSTDSLMVSDALHSVLSGTSCVDVAKQVASFAPPPLRAPNVAIDASQ